MGCPFCGAEIEVSVEHPFCSACGKRVLISSNLRKQESDHRASTSNKSILGILVLIGIVVVGGIAGVIAVETTIESLELDIYDFGTSGGSPYRYQTLWVYFKVSNKGSFDVELTDAGAQLSAGSHGLSYRVSAGNYRWLWEYQDYTVKLGSHIEYRIGWTIDLWYPPYDELRAQSLSGYHIHFWATAHCLGISKEITLHASTK